MEKPQLPYNDVLKVLDSLLRKWRTERVVLLAVRGYFLRSMGDPTKNDRGIYDDAAFVVEPPQHNAVTRWNFNTDPSGYAQGRFVLNKGVWRFAPKIHKTYPAFGQVERVRGTRDGQGECWATPEQNGINLHHGSPSGRTSSLGCQTVPVEQWTVPDPGIGFRQRVYNALDVSLEDVRKYGKEGVPGKEFFYVLADHAQVEAIIGRAF